MSSFIHIYSVWPSAPHFAATQIILSFSIDTLSNRVISTIHLIEFKFLFLIIGLLLSRPNVHTLNSYLQKLHFHKKRKLFLNLLIRHQLDKDPLQQDNIIGFKKSKILEKLLISYKVLIFFSMQEELMQFYNLKSGEAEQAPTIVVPNF